MTEDIMHRAHNWAGPTAPGKGDVICVNCGIITKVGEWDIPRCHWQRASKESGYLPE